ncbi:MAG TPA: ABC transporter ATP-binding protein, partial [Acidimicrobiales bacterium]|nr:ABC transporter ATP-binding protein [Acidimicrobiales bacterium]
MLEVRGLRVTYGSTVAVEGLDLTVDDQGAAALLGPNGAGKTSTLRAISRLIPHTGTVTFDGEDLAGLAADEVARRGMVHVPEGRHVFPTLTVEENLRMGQVAARRRPRGFSLDDIYDLFPALTPLRSRDGFALSGGEQQMVAIGRALVAAPKLLLLDEPSLGLAPVIMKAVFKALDDIRQRTPLLLVEQNTQQALAVCDRASVMVNGRIEMTGKSDE